MAATACYSCCSVAVLPDRAVGSSTRRSKRAAKFASNVSADDDADTRPPAPRRPPRPPRRRPRPPRPLPQGRPVHPRPRRPPPPFVLSSPFRPRSPPSSRRSPFLRVLQRLPRRLSRPLPEAQTRRHTRCSLSVLQQCVPSLLPPSPLTLLQPPASPPTWASSPR